MADPCGQPRARSHPFKSKRVALYYARARSKLSRADWIVARFSDRSP